MFDSGILDQYHVADTSKCFLDARHCNVVPNNVASIQKNRHDKSHHVIVPHSTKYWTIHAMFTQNDFWAGLEIDPIHCEQYSGKPNHT